VRDMADVQLIDLPQIEFLDGKAYPKVSPKLSHALVQGALCRIVHRLAGKRGRVAPELDVWPSGIRGSGTKFVPDVAYVSIERLRSLTPEQREEPPFSPDIAIEVWSPSNERWYLEQKIARYLATGSTLVLDVDPATRTIVVHDCTSVQHYACGETFEHATFDWLRFEVAEVFADLDDD
jgi:Uma2 family endonuclease